MPKFLPWLLLILTAILLIRLPSFFEPHWYGDEEIYLVIGQTLRRGAVLYRDIWDNKPPVLYLIYALYPTLLWAKISAAGFVLATGAAIFFLARKIFADFSRPEFFSLLAVFLTGLLLSLPALEGNIANAELYFTFPIALAAFLLWQKRDFPKQILPVSLLLGLLFSLAFFLKVPAAFDFLGLFLAVTLIRLMAVKNPAGLKKFFRGEIKFYLPVMVIFLFISSSLIGYFYFNHALGDFLTASFVQNASYVAVDSGPLSRLSNPLFVKGFLLLIFLAGLTWRLRRKKISPEFFFLSVWVSFSLYGALLSNRPYLHYLLQIIPPAVLFLIYLITRARKYPILFLLTLSVVFSLTNQFKTAFHLNGKGYYENFLVFSFGRKSYEDYINYFDSRTANNYRTAAYLADRTTPSDTIFVWDDNAALYDLSDRAPAAKFIQAHHLTTIDPKNYALLAQKLAIVQPKLIVVARPVHFAFPELEALLLNRYQPTAAFDHLFVYRLSGAN